MNTEQPSESTLEVLAKIVKEVSSLSIGLIGYFVALFGLADVEYAKTLSVVTLVLTTVFLAQWRWRRIAEKKEKKGKATKRKTKALDYFLNPLRGVHADLYRLPLLRRRVEAGVLGVLSLFTLVWTGMRLPSIVREWTFVPNFSCHAPDEETKYRVVVASLNQHAEQELVIAESIFNTLVDKATNHLYTVCRLDKVLENVGDAEQAIVDYEADVVIWGSSDAQGYEVKLSAPKLAELDRNASQVGFEEAASFSFQKVELDNVAFITQFTLTELLILDGRFDEAKVKLKQSLLDAEQTGGRKENLANGYYLLGLYYDPYFSPAADIQKAIESYSQALENNADLFEARVNRASLNVDLGEFEDALTDLSYLIEHGKREYQGMAYINRADLPQRSPEERKADLDAAVDTYPELGYFYRGLWYVEAKEYALARDDLQQAVLYTPEVYFCYEYLGIAQLHMGEEEAARDTFAKMVPYLTAEDRADVIADLEAEGNAYPELEPGVGVIIEALKSAEIE